MTRPLPDLHMVPDYHEEGWISMTVCSDMLHDQLLRDHAERIRLHREIPRFIPDFQRIAGKSRPTFNADRFINRFIRYPAWIKSRLRTPAIYHVVDHSYAHLLHSLPGGVMGCYCHDIDAFRSLFDPSIRWQRRWYNGIAQLLLSGIRRADVVFHSTRFVREEILQHGIVEPDRLVQAPLGFSAQFCAEPVPLSERLKAALEPMGPSRFLLHVGSCVPRKRVDVLLETLAGVRREVDDLWLVKVSGTFSPQHEAIIEREGLRGRIVHLQGLSTVELAALFQRCAMVLQPSSKEGFGMPIIEAMACGALVLASDIPVLREVGGQAAVYVELGNVQAWTAAVAGVLSGAEVVPTREQRLEQAGRYSWRTHAGIIVNTYLRLGGYA